MRRTTVIVLLALAAACGTGVEAADENNGTLRDSTLTTSTTTTTTLATTTTTDPCAGEPFSIDESRTTTLEPGCTYVNADFAIPMTLVPEEAGWVSFGYGNRWFSLDLDADDDGATDAALTVLLYEENLEPAAVLENLAGIDRITAQGELVETPVGGLSATALDIRLSEHSRFPCGNRISRFLNTGSYVALVNEGPNRTFGIPACRTSRIWAVPVGDTVVTLIGAVKDDAAFGDLIPVVEAFLSDNVTFGNTDG